jgi:hypothetical protein
MEKPKNVGINYLHRHPKTEYSLGLDNEHVIVDRKHWSEVVSYFQRHPEEVEKIV